MYAERFDLPEIDRDLEYHARPNWVEIDASAIRDNLKALRRMVGPNVKIFATLKGNACGFGIAKAATTIGSGGADAIATVDLSDAIKVRRAGVRLPVLLFGGNFPTVEVVEAIERHDFIVTFHDRASAEGFLAKARGRIKVFIETNVGGERFGVDPEETPAFASWVHAQDKAEIVGFSAHMHVPKGEVGLRLVDWQYRRFLAALAATKDAGVPVPLRMIASSRTLILTREMNLDAVDPGHLVFGLMPTDNAVVETGVRPAFFALKSRLIAVRNLARSAYLDETPFPARAGLRFGVIPMGSSDALARLTVGTVLVRGRRAPLLGSPATEHARIDLTDVPDAAAGDEVVVIGRQGENSITLDEVHRHHGVLTKDIISSLPAAMPRVYLDFA